MRGKADDSGTRRRAGLGALAALLIAAGLVWAMPPVAGAPAELPLGDVVGDVAPGSQLVDCSQAGVAVTVTVSSHLDPSCTYTKGFTITASDVVLDCRGAHIESAAGSGRGILVRTDAGTPLARVTVRNCVVGGFLNNVRVTRDGFKDLTPDDAYDHPTSDIVIENSLLHDSQGSGLFVDGYVSDVTVQDLRITGSGSVGIYLEAGSRDNVVQRNHLSGNGWRENGPGGQTFELGGQTYRWWGTGREGLAIDGSRFNVVRDNTFETNSAGGIFLYKNCGESATEQPAQHWSRWTPAEGNVIEHNAFVGERTGVWVASRQAENQLFMDCSDPAYLSDAVTRIHLDPAPGNTVRDNSFTDVTYGVRVEDDDTTVQDNTFTAANLGAQAVIVGTLHRTTALGLPVARATVTGNAAAIAGNPFPFRWIHGITEATYEGNTSGTTTVSWCEGTQPPINPFLFVVEFRLDAPGVTPTPTTTPTTPPPPCPADPSAAPVAATTSAAVVTPAFTG